MPEVFDWLKPSPLWQAAGEDFRQQDFFRPQLLEFRSDDFLEDFLAAARAKSPAALQQALAAPVETGKPLKLFQPVHGCFYLVSGSLCCRQPGFPDREVRSGDGEQVFAVLRRVAATGEYGWVPQQGWQLLGDQARRVLPNEERLPLFAALAGNGRPLFYGYIPVTSRETYKAAPSESPVDYTNDPRLEELAGRFKEPLGVLAAAPDPLAIRLSVYLLLELWEYFATYLPDVADALSGERTVNLTGAPVALVEFLKTQPLGGSLKLAAALGEVARWRNELDALGNGPLPSVFTSNYSLKGRSLDLNGLHIAVKRALPEATVNVSVPKLGPRTDTPYVLRCVYERPQCDPPHRDVSLASRRFELAGFADADAPARSIRIALPADVSIAGLRKFKKGVAFMMSDGLKNKLAQIAGRETNLLKGESPNQEGTDSLGHICSFSIQIIFLCAFILLIIIVVVLNIVFWWMLFFKICFPLKLPSK